MNAPILADGAQQASPLDDIQLPPIGETASARQWRLREADLRVALAISQKVGLDPVLARILAARGVSAENADAYLNPSLRETLPDPSVLKDMDRAVARIAEAIEAGEQVGVFGDYDVDGTSGAAILKTYFNAIGQPLEIYLPDRILEGYGPSIEAFRTLAEKGVTLIITVDCGASAHDPVEQAGAEGIDIVVMDHHLMDREPPAGATAVVNPNRADDISGLTNLSAAGVAFFCIVALNRHLREAGYFQNRQEPNLLSLLDLTALGLVCDVMSMTGVTRLLVAQGLKVMDMGGNQGLRALGERAGVKGKASTYHLGFLLGPRINAAGRVGHARLAFELLTTADASRRAALAEKLHLMNAERQEIEAAVQEEALSQVERENLASHAVIVAAGQGWHPGVIGIVAGRIKEIFDKPTIVIGIENGVGKGSGRSLSGVDLGSQISALKAQGVLIAGGGHAMAAGLTVAEDKIPDLRTALNERLGDEVRLARQNRRLSIDALIAPGAVTAAFAEMVERAGPFGPDNPEPVFAIANLRAEYVKSVGKNHLACTLMSETGDAVRAIAFRADGEPLGEMLKSGARLHAAGKVRPDDWRGRGAGQLQILDLAKAI